MEVLLFAALFVFLIAAVGGTTAVQTPIVMGGDSVSRAGGCVTLLLAAVIIGLCVLGLLAIIGGGALTFNL